MEKVKNPIKKCEICETNVNSFCYQCLCYFCDNCYSFVHEKECNLKHKKEQIDPFVPIELKCPTHLKSPLNLFCVDEKGNYNIKYLY